MLCDDLGRLLSALPIYVNGIFGDDAIVGKLESDDDEFLLKVTIMIRTYYMTLDEFKKKLEALEELIYNPSKHNDYLLSKVYIRYEFYD